MQSLGSRLRSLYVFLLNLRDLYLFKKNIILIQIKIMKFKVRCVLVCMDNGVNVMNGTHLFVDLHSEIMNKTVIIIPGFGIKKQIKGAFK